MNVPLQSQTLVLIHHYSSSKTIIYQSVGKCWANETIQDEFFNVKSSTICMSPPAKNSIDLIVRKLGKWQHCTRLTFFRYYKLCFLMLSFLLQGINGLKAVSESGKLCFLGKKRAKKFQQLHFLDRIIAMSEHMRI